MTKQDKFDDKYMRMACIWAENSYAERRKVGCLIVKDNMIISDGYNGTPSGFENVCEDENGKTKPYVLHAEANAITKLAKSGNSSLGATLYVTTSPCMECSKLIIQAGITRVVYQEEYHNTDGLEILQRAGIEVVHLPVKEDNEFLSSVSSIAEDIYFYLYPVDSEEYIEGIKKHGYNIKYYIDAIDGERENDTENAKSIAARALELLMIKNKVSEPCQYCKRTLYDITELLVRKNHDYGNSFGNQLKKHGSVVFKIRLEDKCSRLDTLMKKQAQVQDESLEDTLRDIIGYCILFIHES